MSLLYVEGGGGGKEPFSYGFLVKYSISISPCYFLTTNYCLQEIGDVWVILLGLGLVVTALFVGIAIFIFQRR